MRIAFAFYLNFLKVNWFHVRYYIVTIIINIKCKISSPMYEYKKKMQTKTFYSRPSLWTLFDGSSSALSFKRRPYGNFVRVESRFDWAIISALKNVLHKMDVERDQVSWPGIWLEVEKREPQMQPVRTFSRWAV